MKKMFMSFLIMIISLMFLAEASEPLRPGLQVKMGELTGAGSKYSVHGLAGFVLNNQILMKEDCTSITIRQTANPLISDIVKVKAFNQEIMAAEFTGFVIND